MVARKRLRRLGTLRPRNHLTKVDQRPSKFENHYEGQWPHCSRFEHKRHDLWNRKDNCFFESRNDIAARRCDLHRDSSRCGHGKETAVLVEGWGHGGSGIGRSRNLHQPSRIWETESQAVELGCEEIDTVYGYTQRTHHALAHSF